MPEARVLSLLFAGNALLESIAADQERISRERNRNDPAVGLVQSGLLIWDPGCLPTFGADGDYGDETAGAVVRFKAVELGVPPEEIIDDVGPRTVVRLDEIAAVSEYVAQLGVAAIALSGLDAAGLAPLFDAVAATGGAILLGLGDRVAVVSGGQATVDALAGLVGPVLSGLVAPGSTDLPYDVDIDTVEAVLAWSALADPGFALQTLAAAAAGASFDFLGGCGRGVAA